MRNVYLVGFLSDDSLKVDALLSSGGYVVHDISDSVTDSLLVLKDTQVVLVGVYDKESIKRMKKILTDIPQHIYACGVSNQDRDLLFSVLMAGIADIFFFPPDDNELKRITKSLWERIRVATRERHVFRGLKESRQLFEWRTGDIEISKTCQYAAGVLRQMGFYTDSTEEAHAALALEEALINSVEHGNLELDSSLRPESILEEDKYEALRLKRLEEEKYSGRKIQLTIEMDRKAASVSIRDEGQGFDTSKVRSGNESEYDLQNIMDISGKGYGMIIKPFDMVQYNEAGTEIALTVKKK